MRRGRRNIRTLYYCYCNDAGRVFRNNNNIIKYRSYQSPMRLHRRFCFCRRRRRSHVNRGRTCACKAMRLNNYHARGLSVRYTGRRR